MKAPWRFHQGNYAWSEHQVELQVSNGGNPADVYTRLKTVWEQAARQDIWDSLEEGLWNTPDNTNMEQDGGKLPYSIPTFITPTASRPPASRPSAASTPRLQTKCAQPDRHPLVGRPRHQRRAVPGVRPDVAQASAGRISRSSTPTRAAPAPTSTR